jgi:hypothetical protein
MVLREGLQVQVGGDNRLDQPVVYLAGHPAPFLLLGRHQLADQHFKLALALGQGRGALGDPPLESLVEAQDLLLRLLAFGDVPHDSEHEASAAIRFLHGAYGAQGQLDPDLLAILSHGGQVQQRVRVDVGTTPRLTVAGNARAVRGLERLGDQRLDAQLQRLGSRVAEHLHCSRVPEDYALGLGVRDDDRVPDPLEEFAETEVFGTQAVDYLRVAHRNPRPERGSRRRVVGADLGRKPVVKVVLLLRGQCPDLPPPRPRAMAVVPLPNRCEKALAP